MAFCPRGLSICCMCLSVWGIVQLGLMGVFFYMHSMAFAEDVAAQQFDDIEIEKDKENDTTAKLLKFYDGLDDGWTTIAINCWIAAALYVLVLAISVQQFRSAGKATPVK